MRILYAADHKFKEMWEISAFRTHMLSYSSITYDLGGLGEGEKWEPAVNSKELRHRKPKYMLKAMKDSNDTIVWMDADAIIRRPIDEFCSFDPYQYDIAVTCLPKLKLCACPVVVNPTKGAEKFMKSYIKAAATAPRGDMYGLRAHFDKYHSLQRHSIGKICNIEGSWVKVLDAKVYLHKIRTEEDLENIPDTAKIVHFSGKGHRGTRDSMKLDLMRKYNGMER